MRVSTEHSFVFMSMPKCGTTTFYKVLEDFFGAEKVPGDFHTNVVPQEYQKLFRWTVCRNPYIRAVSLWWSACRLNTKDMYGFVKGCGSNNDFVRFVEWLAETEPKHALMYNQSEWAAAAQPFDAVLQLENIKEELKRLPFWQDDIKLPLLNTTNQKLLAYGKGAPSRPHWINIKKGLMRLPFWRDDIKLPLLNTTKRKLLAYGKEAPRRLHWIEFYQDDRAVKAVQRWAMEDFKQFSYSMS